MKNTRSHWLLALVAGIVPTIGQISIAQAAQPYHLLAEIPVGGDGFWDYLSVDPSAHRLYVSHATEIAVIDTKNNQVIGHIADTPGVHGFAIATDLGRGFSSNGRENTSSIVDLKSLKTLSRTDTGANPDAILYDPANKEVYTFNGHGESATAFDAASGKVTATIPLGGKPEFAVVDPKSKLIYDNLEDKNEVAVIDTGKHTVVNTWPIAPGEAASGMAFDEANHRLFLGCDNKLMVMMDSTNGKVVATVPIGEGVDANAFDPATRLAFSSNGEGTVTIAHEESPEKLTVVQTLATEKGARTMTLDPSTHRIYLATAKFEAAAPQAPGTPRQRPKIVPGSFKVLVYGTDAVAAAK
jgi:YVTN family beta-propeller protein